MMMKITCKAIRELLPSDVEQMASDDSREMMDEHLEACMESSSYLHERNAFSKFLADTVDTENLPLQKLKSTLRKKKVKTVIFLLMLTLILGILVANFLTAPEYIPYREGSVSIVDFGNGSVHAQFESDVAGYDISRYPTDDSSGFVYHLTAWDSIWNKSIAKSHTNNVVINPTGEAVAAVYYYQTDGSEDILIYGKDLHSSGGVVTLPRLFLGFYSLIAISLTLICGLIMITFRRHKNVTSLTTIVLLLPLSYLLGQLLIKGFVTSSYEARREFYIILLIMIPLYIAFLTAMILSKEYRGNRETFKR